MIVPVEQLRLRLCGTKKQREEAYILDWLTFCAHWGSIPLWLEKHKQYQHSPLPIPTNYEELKGELDGNYLAARDTAGNLAGSLIS